MELSRKAIDEIRSFELNRGVDTGTCLLKQQTTPGVGHLIISLGGSGADMLREVKALINRNCCSDTDKHEAPQRVAYVAIDTDEHEREKVSHIKTGQVKLGENELIILSNAELPALFDQRIKDYNKSKYPWIYKWLDTDMPQLTGANGAGGYRQAGRAMLFLNIDKVQSSLDKALTKLITGTGVESLNVYILSGVSGGTGSGTFLDMAYIARKLVYEKYGYGVLRPESTRVYGYLIMPDVNLLKANDDSRPTILKNAGAALQELDNAMKLPRVKDYYECKYSNTLEIKTYMPPFNFVHLISAKASGKSMPAEPYQHCLDTVAGSILCFVSGQGKIDAAAGARNRVVIEFPVDLFYRYINMQQNNAEAMNPYKERSNCYISTEYSCWEIPADIMVKFIFTQIFSKMDDLFKNEPVQGDADRFMEKMGYHCEDLVVTLMGKRTNPFDPAQFNKRMLFGRGSMRLEDYLPFDERCRDIDNRFYALMSKIREELKEELQESFRDAERGPIWTNHLLVKTFSRIDSLDILLDEEKDYAMSKLTTARTTCRAKMQEIQKMRENSKAIIGKTKVKEYIDAWNEYFNSYLEAHCYELLIGKEAALAEIGENYRRGFFDEVINTATKYNNAWLDISRQVLEELRTVVQKNTDEIKIIAAVPGGVIGLPNLVRAIDSIIDQAGIRKSDLQQKFLDRLLDKADEWAKNIEVRKFIEEFLENEAQPVLCASLEDLLWLCSDGDGALLHSVKENLISKMKYNEVPLLGGNITDRVVQGISIPPDCPQIREEIASFIDYRNTYSLHTSYLRNRISVISMTVGLSLHDYAWSEECEQQLSLDPAAHGLFLNQGDTNFPGARNDMMMPLPPVIPTRKRPAGQKAPERFKKFEENLVKEFREMRAGRYPFLYFRKTGDLRDYDLHLVLSVDLIHSPFGEMIKEENYLNYDYEVDEKKLTQLIKELKDIRYNTGLPEKSVPPKRLIICQNLLHAATQEMKDRYKGLFDEDAEKIKEEVAWEVAEWFYVSAYSLYMRAKEEKAKYDEIEDAIKKFESILDDLEQRPMRCATMARMLASGAIKYDEKLSRYTYLVGGKDVPIVEVEAAYLRVKDLALYEALEKLRTGDDKDKYLYNELCHRAYDNYDELVKEYYLKAYDEKDERSGKFPETAVYIRKFIELYKRIDEIRTEVKKKWVVIADKLQMRDHVDNAAENPKTKEFYRAYYQGLDRYIKQDGQIAACTEKLKIRGADDNMLPEDKIFEKKIKEDRNETGGAGNTWTCPKCGSTGNTGRLCLECGTPKPVSVITWTCHNCGRTGNTGRFCPTCGTKRP